MDDVHWLVSGLASGCTILLFDGNPFSPTEESLLRAVDEEMSLSSEHQLSISRRLKRREFNRGISLS